MSIFFKYTYNYHFFFKNKKITKNNFLKRYIKVYKDPFHISFGIVSLNFLIFENILVNTKIKPLITAQLKHQLFSSINSFNSLLLN